MSEPEDQMAAGHAHLRASHADRDQAVETLKIAYVQGRLLKDELDARVARAFASRTYAELSALTDDLPAGLLRPEPQRTGARTRLQPSMNAALTGGAFMMLALTALMLGALVSGSGAAVLLVALLMTVGVAVALTAIIRAS